MIRRLFLVVLSLVLASSSSLLAYSGGGGTTSNPYQISTESDLYDLSQNPSDWSSSFVITANLDLSSYPNITIGTSSTPFTGTFNGGNVTADYAYRDGRDIAVEGYAITGYSISATNSNIGLFGYIGVGGDVRNIFLIDPIVQGGSSSDSVGAICGYNKGTISDCTAIKSVSASDDQVNVSGDDRVGAICGQNDAGDIIGCYSYLYVKADSEVAGIVGYQKNSGSVYQSCSGGHIEGTSGITAKVAGIVGNNNAGNLTDCYSEADLTGSKYVGGIIGINTGGTITNCYFADGTIACDSYEGALVGDRNSGTFVGCLYDSSLGLDAIGDGSYTGMVGKTKEELRSTATYEDAGFDFETAWLILDTADYARLDGVGVQLADLPNITPAITSQLLFSANAGTSFSISFQDSNNGTIAAGAYTSKLYFNTSDSDWDSLIGTVGDATTATPGYIEMSAIAGLSVGADYSETFNVIANSSIDNMYFRVYSDTNDDVTEFNETDNWSETVVVTVNRVADLVVSAVPEASLVDPSATVNIGANIANTGSADAAAFDVLLYVSDTPVVDWPAAIAGGTTLLVDSINVASLVAGANTTETFTFTADSTPSTKYYAFLVDSANVIAESNEDNNFSQPATPSGNIEVTVRSGIDLLATTGTSSIDDMYVGASESINVTAQNAGVNPVSAFDIDMQTSPDGSVWTTIASENVASLAAGASVSKSFTLNADVAGIYHVRFIIDSANSVSEDDEFNNIWSAGSFEIVDTIDLAVSITGSLSVEAGKGEPVAVPFTVTNSGSGEAAPAFDATLYMSQDGNWATATAVTSVQVDPIAAGGNYSADFNVTLPVVFGTYYYRAMVDSSDVVSEVPAPANENNNWSGDVVTVEIPALIDLYITSGPTDLGEVYKGSAVNLDVDVENGGDGVTGAFNVMIYLSTDGVNWFEVASEAVASLNAGGSDTVNFSFTPESSAGVYQAKAVVNADNAVVEDDTTNNMWDLGELEIKNLVDLTTEFPVYVTDFVRSAGQSVSLPFTISNAGTGTALPLSGQIQTALMLSNTNGDWETSSNAALYGVSYVGPNSSSEGVLQFAAPSLPGTYYLRLDADSTDVVGEVDETNNYSTNVIVMTVVPSIDLAVATYPTSGVEVFLAQNATVQATVVNQGINPSGAFNVSIYKSAIEGADWETLSPVDTQSVSSVNGGSNANVNFNFALTETEPTTVYLRIKADSASQVTETAEVNNWSGIFALEIKPNIDLTASYAGTVVEKYTGDNVEVSFNAANGGISESGASSASLYISTTDSGWSALGDSAIVDTISVASILPSGSAVLPTSFVAPSQAGTYYLRLKMDKPNSVEEINETNNWSNTVTLRINAIIDLVTTITDTTVSSFDGLQTVISANVTAQGAGNAGASTCALYYSSTNDFGSAMQIATKPINALNSGLTTSFSYVFNAPAAGDYYFWSVADSANAVYEHLTAEDNNVSAPLMVTVNPYIDLTIENATTNFEGYAGQTLSADLTPSNGGTAASGECKVTLYINDVNADWDSLGSEDIAGSYTLGSGLVGLGSLQAVQFTLPAAAGEYYLKAIVDADDQVLESSENNNWSNTMILTVSPEVDLTVSIPADKITVYDDDSLEIDFTVDNSANGPATAFDVTLYYSTDSSSWETAPILANVNVAGIDAGGSYEGTFEFVAPDISDAYYIRATVDSADVIFERNAEDNNDSQTAQMDVLYAFSGGDGSQYDPYIIMEAQDVVDLSLAELQLDAYYILMSDIDMAGVPIDGIGDNVNPFAGVLDGNNYVISNISIASDDYTAFFVNLTGQVFNLGLEDIFVFNPAGDVAGFAYTMTDATAEGVYVTGNISGLFASGFATNVSSSTITRCYSDCDMTFGGGSNGFVNVTNGTTSITNCYSNCTVLSPSPLGVYSAIIANMSVETTVTDCFWNTARGGANSTAGVGLNDAEMKDEQNFINAGWDYITETTNGTGDFWYTGADGYPEFTWTIYGGGGGSCDNPFVIRTPQQMYDLANNSGDWGFCYFLDNSIDLGGFDMPQIGTQAVPFTGSFDGQYHTISGMQYMTDANACGLFGYNAGLIQSLTVAEVDIDVDGSESDIATLVKYNSGTVSQCQVLFGTIEVSGAYNNIGAVVAVNDGIIEQCYANCDMTSTGDLEAVGQISGKNSGTIESCYADGSITANGVVAFAGFITGMNATTATVVDCYTTKGVLSLSEDDVFGALVGVNLNESTTSLSGCFYNTQTSPSAVGAGDATGASGYIAEQMHGSSIYQAASWDGSLWMYSSSYPVLRWQTGMYQGFMHMADNWLEEGVDIRGDYNGDEIVNYLDFAYLASMLTFDFLD